MTMPLHDDPVVLTQLRALIGEALALADGQQLHAAGIALDTARLSVEDRLNRALASATGGSDAPERSVRNGGSPRERGSGVGG